jgi:hypothetical protein
MGRLEGGAGPSGTGMHTARGRHQILLRCDCDLIALFVFAKVTGDARSIKTEQCTPI